MRAGQTRRSLVARCLLVASTVLVAAGAWADTYAGRPVTDALEALSGPGLEFIYSSELVPASLRVRKEPRASNRLAIAREILVGHGLGLRLVRPGLYAVVAQAAPAAEATFRGELVAEGTGAPVASARVVLLPIGAAGWTRADGRFEVGPVPEGRYTVRVEAPGFETALLPDVDVTRASQATSVSLVRARTQLGEVVVSTSRYALDRSSALGSILIAGEDLAAQPAIGEDALRTLGRLPGVAQNGISAQTSIRGGEAGELLTLLDGFPLRQAFHLPGYQSLFGVLDPGLVGESVVYTGGFPVRYGNRMAGVYDLRTIDAGDEPRTALGLSVFNAMARRAGTLDRYDAEWLGIARVGTLRPLVEAFAPDEAMPSYSDVYGRAAFDGPGGVRLSSNLLWTRDELSIEREDHGERASIESRNRYLWLRADREWPRGIEATMWLGHSTVDSFRRGEIDRPGIAAGTVDDRRSSGILELRGRAAWDVSPRHWLDAGFEWTAEDATYRYAANAEYDASVAELFAREPTLERSTTIHPHRERIALFASHRWQPFEPLTSELGLRAQRTITSGGRAETWLFDPRLSLRWQLAPATSLRAHWGRFHQTDEVHELKVEDGLAEFPEAQRSDHFIVGLEHRFAGGQAARLEWFRKLQSDPRPHFENLLDPMTVLPEIAPDRVRVAPLAAEVRGAELSYFAGNGALDWWASLSWSEAWDGVDGLRIPRSWDQSWAVAGGVDWVRGNWRFGAVASAHRGWPVTRIRDGELGPRNAERHSPRATLDLRIEHRRPLAVGSLAITFELVNAVNLGNTCCYKLVTEDDGAGGTRFATRASEWLPIVPSIGVLWEF